MNISVSINNIVYPAIYISTQQGLTDADTLNGIAYGGNATITLRGSLYQSSLNGWKQSWPVQISVNPAGRDNQQGTSHTIWSGKLESVTPQVNNQDGNTIRITAADIFSRFPRSRYDTFLYLDGNADSGSVINSLLDNIGWPTADRVIDTGIITIAAGALNSASGLGNARQLSNIYNSLKLISRAELGFIYVDRLNRIVFENQEHRLNELTVNTPSVFLSTAKEDERPVNYFGAERINYTESKIYNRFVTTLTKYEAQSSQLIYRTDDDFSKIIPHTHTYNHVGYINQFNDNDNQFILFWNPVVYSARYVNGPNTGPVLAGITVDDTETFTDRFITKFTNNTGQDIIITKIEKNGINQLRSNPQPFGVMAEDRQSIVDYDDISEFQVPITLIVNRDKAQDTVSKLLIHSTPNSIITVRFLADENSLTLTNMLNTTVGRFIRLHDNTLGLVSDFPTKGFSNPEGRLMFVEAEKHTIDLNKHYVEYVLSDAEALYPYLVADWSKLGINSRLG